MILELSGWVHYSHEGPYKREGAEESEEGAMSRGMQVASGS